MVYKKKIVEKYIKKTYPILSVADQTFKNPGLREKRPIFVRMQRTNGINQSSPTTDGSSDSGRSLGNLDSVERIRKGLRRRLEAIKTSADDVGNSVINK